MWSVSKRTGTSNSKSAMTSTPSAGGVPKVTSPVVVSIDQLDSCSMPESDVRVLRQNQRGANSAEMSPHARCR
jgi:hypothetical protein